MKPGSKAVVAVIGAMLGWGALCVPTAAGAVSFSDDFADRGVVAGLPTEVTGSNVGADRETGEPVLKPLSPASHSVWLEWEATSTGYVTLSTCGSAVSTVFGVYAGNELDKLTEVASGYHFVGGECSAVRNGATFLASAGTKFQIALDGNNFFVPSAPPPVTAGPLALRLEATPPPVNDDLAAATPLLGSVAEEPGGRRPYFASAFGYNWGADKESLEPDHGGDQGGASVWYSWTAPATGSAQVGVCCGSYLLGVYLGDSLNSLTAVKLSAFGTLPVVAGTTYRLAVDGRYDLVNGAAKMGGFNLTASMELPPAGPVLPPVQPPPAAGAAAAAANPVAASEAEDSTAPQTTLGARKVRSAARTASFGFRADEAVAGFRCRLDAGKVALCRSPKVYSGLAPGRHVFRVYAVDLAGNADTTPAVARFAIAPPQRKPGAAPAARLAPVTDGPINVADFERVAAEKLDPGALGYFAGGAGVELTLRDNVAAWSRWRLRPRVLAGLDAVSTATEVLGAPLSMPILVAPVAYQRLVDPEGEIGMARAAAAAGTAMCLSTLATTLPSEVAAAVPDGPALVPALLLQGRGGDARPDGRSGRGRLRGDRRHRRRPAGRQPRARPAAPASRSRPASGSRPWRRRWGSSGR